MGIVAKHWTGCFYYFWLASRCVNLNNNNCNFNVRYVNSGNVNGNNLANSNNSGANSNNNRVVPVASINLGYITNGYIRANRNKLYPLIMCNNYKIKIDNYIC